MAKYGKFLYYKKASDLPPTQYLSVTFTIEYNITAYLSIAFILLYNITGIDARSLWEPKAPEQALWEELDRSDPASYPVPRTADFLQCQDGTPLLQQNGDYIYLA